MDKQNKVNLSKDQEKVFSRLLDFIESKTQKVFILCGYAGTGKTTMMRHLIDELRKRNEMFSLHASTGRAAKILSNITGVNATTVHSLLYKFSDFNQNLDEVEKDVKMEKNGQLLLTFEMSVATSREKNVTKFYIVDEASMISDIEDVNPSQAVFGSGRLLHDLLSYDCFGKFIFVGDIAQLPPVKSSFSPALSVEYINNTYHVNTVYAELTKIMRQGDDNDLIKSASKIRQMFVHPPLTKWGKFPMRNYSHIKLRSSQVELLNDYIEDIRRNGYRQATMIARSNSQCSILTRTIRPSLGFASPYLCVGDLLMITQNNLISGLMNGDMVKVVQIGSRVQKAGLTFLQVEVEELFTNLRYSQLLIEEIVYGLQTNLMQSQQQRLFLDFYYRMKDKGIAQSTKSFKDQMMKDEYLNALRAVYGYVLTCHKAQGGEWENVYLDIPRNTAFNPNANTYQWLYTAMTRASDTLHIVNDFYIE